jgi:signal transduction histidine kinase
MAVELAEIAAGLPFAASLAMASGISAFREGRRRTSLNEALHELRRPLQVLALSLPADSRAVGSALQMARAAVEQLEREVNGDGAATPAQQVSIRPLLTTAVDRWRPRAAAEGRSLKLIWAGGEIELRGDRTELSQALDNLISNALEHGAGAVTVDVSQEAGLLRVTVRNRDTSAARPNRRGRVFRARRNTRRRHGHGLRIVRRVAARHGGSFRLTRSAASSEARLDLPLEGPR